MGRMLLLHLLLADADTSMGWAWTLLDTATFSTFTLQYGQYGTHQPTSPPAPC